MPDESPRTRERDATSVSSQSEPSSTSSGPSRMLARTWVIAAQYNDPADYGTPSLPAWHVSRTDGGGLTLAADADADPFVRAERPMTVRR